MASRIALLALLVGCGGPTASDECTILCSDEGGCPSGMACSIDGYCHEAGSVADCSPDDDPAPPPPPAADPPPDPAPAAGCPLDCPVIDPASIELEAGVSTTFVVHGGAPPFTFQVVFGGGSVTADGVYTAPTGHGYSTVVVTDANGDDSLANVGIRKTRGVTVGARVGNVRDLSLVCGHPGYWGHPRDSEKLEFRTAPDGTTEVFGLAYPVAASGADGGDWQCVNWAVEDRKLCDLSGSACQYVTSVCNQHWCGDFGPYLVTLAGGTVTLDRWNGAEWERAMASALEY